MLMTLEVSVLTNSSKVQDLRIKELARFIPVQLYRLFHAKLHRVTGQNNNMKQHTITSTLITQDINRRLSDMKCTVMIWRS